MILYVKRLQVGGPLDALKSALNPKNWGVTDYSSTGNFSSAYTAAKKAGEKEFMWNNKRYNTALKNEPGRVIKIRDNFQRNNFISHLTSGGDGRKKEPGYGTLTDLYRYYGGDELTHEVLQKSLYKPTITKTDENYIAIKDDNFIQEVLDTYNRVSNGDLRNSSHGKEFKYEGKDLYNVSGYLNKKEAWAMGHYNVGKGKDNRGEYISYYDKFDATPGNSENFWEKLGVVKPFEIYDRIYIKDYGDGKQKRMYYSDKELSELNPDTRSFDTLALQKELSNRGYKLPGSTKKDGSFDGTLGPETIKALQDYQSKNKK